MNLPGESTLYPNVLDHKPGFFLSWFLYRLFKRISLNEDMKDDLKRMHREGTVVYAIKYWGRLDYLLYHYNFRRRRLPYPKIAFDLNMSILLPLTQLVRVILSQLRFWIRYGRLPSPYQSGFYKRAIQEGTTSLIFLVHPKGFMRHFLHAEKNHLHFLLETQKEMDRPIFIVPQLVLYKMTPERDRISLASILFGFQDHPGMVRKLGLFLRHNRRAFIDFGQPLNLKAYLEGQPATRPLQDMAMEIRDQLIDSIDRQKRVILGPIMKSRQQLKEIVLMDPRVSQKIEKMASGNHKHRRGLRKKAEEYFEETAADYSTAYVQLFHMFLGWFWKKIFEGIDVDASGLGRVREWARRGPLIYVPSHKSHIDYLILNYVLYNHRMHVPRIAAGRNLAFWPMGHIFKKCGAFFVRRSFTGAKLYTEVFIRYVKALLEEGHPIEFFIEGGRSRNGKLVLPKMVGFLNILLQAYQEGFCDDLIFIPTSITYDRIMEEKSFLQEIGGGVKREENFLQVIRARQLLKRRYGKIYIRFNQPFSLNEFLARADRAEKDINRNLAFYLVEAINQVCLITPLSLVATAILANHRRGFQLSDLVETAKLLLGFVVKHGFPTASTLADPEKAVQETLSLLVNWKAVDFLEDVERKEETFYYVDDDKKVELEYYKNSIIHFFIPHAFVAISLLSGTEEVKDLDSIMSDYVFLRDLFRKEFVFDEKEDLRERLIPILQDFIDSGFLMPAGEEGGYKIAKLGFDKLPIWASLAQTFLESYWVVIKSIGKERHKGLKKRDALKSADYLGRRFHKLGLIEHIGALSRLNYQNAMSLIHETVLSLPESSQETLVFERLSQLGQRLYELSHYRS